MTFHLSLVPIEPKLTIIRVKNNWRVSKTRTVSVYAYPKTTFPKEMKVESDKHTISLGRTFKSRRISPTRRMD